MPIIDIHTHIYPVKIAKKATLAVGNFYNLPMFGAQYAEDALARDPDALVGAEASAAVFEAGLAHPDNVYASTAEDPTDVNIAYPGTVAQLLSATQHCPITHFAVLGVATKDTQVESINNFLIGECRQHPNFIGFASMHQDYWNPEAELRRVRDAGLVGVKIHPDIQGVALNDPRLMEVYAICERLGLAVTLHTGDYRRDLSHPYRLVEVLHTFPKLRVNGAHFGGWSIYDLALEFLEHENCFVDASSAVAFLGRRRVRELIELYGADRVMFGSDYPMSSPAHTYNEMMALGLSEADREKFMWHTAEEFLQREIH